VVLHLVSFVPVTVLGLVYMWQDGLTLGGLKRLRQEARTETAGTPMLVKIAPDLTDEEVLRIAALVVRIGLAGIVVSAAQCANLGPKADPSRFFTLTPVPQTPAGPATCSSQADCGLATEGFCSSAGPFGVPGRSRNGTFPVTLSEATLSSSLVTFFSPATVVFQAASSANAAPAPCWSTASRCSRAWFSASSATAATSSPSKGS
jgi:hypothetical protein